MDIYYINGIRSEMNNVLDLLNKKTIVDDMEGDVNKNKDEIIVAMIKKGFLNEADKKYIRHITGNKHKTYQVNVTERVSIMDIILLNAIIITLIFQKKNFTKLDHLYVKYLVGQTSMILYQLDAS